VEEAPVGARFFTPSSIIGPMRAPNPPASAKTSGTMMSAIIGDMRLLMMRIMNVATITNAIVASTGAPRE
jgi:hypothetical protein